jgi:glycopeptide antibiotics resistance protein
MIQEAPWYEIFYLLVGNIAWFIPIGFLLPLSTRIKPWLAIPCGAGLSLLIEAGQYLFSVGCTDVDDLIFNTLGTAIGALVYVIAKKKLPHLF